MTRWGSAEGAHSSVLCTAGRFVVNVIAFALMFVTEILAQYAKLCLLQKYYGNMGIVADWRQMWQTDGKCGTNLIYENGSERGMLQILY